MPIVVDEVVISIEVTNEGAGGGRTPSAGGATSDRQQMVNECVERVLEVLRQRQER